MPFLNNTIIVSNNRARQASLRRFRPLTGRGMKSEHADFEKTPPLFSLVNTFKAFFAVYNGLSLSLKLMAVSYAPKLVPTFSGQQQANVLLVCDRSFIRFLF
jgi:hypothetical protein